MKNNDNDYLNNLRHSCAHLLAHAVKQLYPGALNAIGPSIENGFYQDFDMGEFKISETDFPKIEKKMREILPSWQKFSFNDVTLAEAKQYDLIDGIYDELVMAENKRKGIAADEWRRMQSSIKQISAHKIGPDLRPNSDLGRGPTLGDTSKYFSEPPDYEL